MELFKNIVKSFRYAGKGIAFCIHHEKNIRIHLVATICVLFISQFYNLNRSEYILVLITCVTVISLEMINTAIEVVIDKISPQYSPLAKTGKDVAAGAVLISAIVSVIIAVILFWDIDTFIRIGKFFIQDIWHIAMLISTLCFFYLFVRTGKKRKVKGKQ